MRETIRIHKPERRGRNGLPVKTREFTATLLGVVEANPMWELGDGAKSRRPIWMSFCGSADSIRPFVANLKAGFPAIEAHKKSVEQAFELPRSARHRWLMREAADAVVVTAYLPELFHLEPTLPPNDVRFVLMPPVWWLEREAAMVERTFGARSRDAARAALLAAYLDRRTQVPVPNDLSFHLALLDAIVAEPWCLRAATDRDPQGVRAEGLEDCGVATPLAVMVKHEVLEEFLAAQVRRFFASRVKRRPVMQLTLEFAVA